MQTCSRALVAATVLALIVLASACSGGGDDDADGGSDGAVSGALSVTLALANDRVAAGGAIPLTVTLTNDGANAVTVARPAIVPTMVYLAVTRDGETVPFDGPWPRLRPLDADAFVELAAGESVSAELDLAEFYTLAPGSYAVVASYRNPQDGAHLGLSALVIEPADEIASDAATFEVQ